MIVNKYNNGGGGGTSDYSQLSNKPQINGVTLDGNKSLEQLGENYAIVDDLSAITNPTDGMYAFIPNDDDSGKTPEVYIYNSGWTKTSKVVFISYYDLDESGTTVPADKFEKLYDDGYNIFITNVPSYAAYSYKTNVLIRRKVIDESGRTFYTGESDYIRVRQNQEKSYCVELLLTVNDNNGFTKAIGIYDLIHDLDAVTSSTIESIWKGKQAEYDAITAKSDSTLYVIMPPATGQDEIWYTSTDDTVVEPATAGTSVFGANIVSNTYSDGKGVIKFDDSVTTIGAGAFSGRQSLSSITIPDSVTSIGQDAFGTCDSLSFVTIGSGVTSIGQGAFYICESLSSITIPDSVTSIGIWAFAACYSLSSVTIGSGVTTIGEAAFSDCDPLDSITYNGTMAQWSNITKGSGWHAGAPATVVHCTDGDISI